MNEEEQELPVWIVVDSAGEFYVGEWGEGKSAGRLCIYASSDRSVAETLVAQLEMHGLCQMDLGQLLHEVPSNVELIQIFTGVQDDIITGLYTVCVGGTGKFANDGQNRCRRRRDATATSLLRRHDVTT